MDFNMYSSNVLTCTQIYNIFSNPPIRGISIHVITIPRKFWRKKVMNKYDHILYDDIDEDVYVFESFGKIMKGLPHFMTRRFSVLILWDKSID